VVATKINNLFSSSPTIITGLILDSPEISSYRTSAQKISPREKLNVRILVFSLFYDIAMVFVVFIEQKFTIFNFRANGDFF